jgi:hypothetical protein
MIPLMGSHHFVKVFDLSESGFKDWEFSAFGLIFIAVGLVVFLFPYVVKWFGIAYLDFQSTRQKLFRYGFLGFALFWTATSFASTYFQYQRHADLVRTNTCRAVEGPVDDFKPMPAEGHADETFSVAGVSFSYSDYSVTDAFNNAASHGGPIRSDSYVRICFDPQDNAILKLEILDFTGSVKSYSNADDIFSGGAPSPRVVPKYPQANIPWYSNLFIILYALDILAITCLYRPYLKTFIRLTSIPIASYVVGGILEDSKRVKLRNMIALWDRNGEAIWLRPRGLNLFQVPEMVAKLSTDSAGSRVVRQEIRFSSGFSVVMIAFFSSAYQFFASSWPIQQSGPTPGEFVGVAAALFIVVGAIGLRRRRIRMEKLIEDAKSELLELSSPKGS